MTDELKDKIIALVEKPLLAEGCELAEVVISKYTKSTTLRLFVYSEHGTTIDECARISRLVGDLIAGTDLFPSRYTLEVSSPGLDRPLKTSRDFRYRIGETVRLEFADECREKLTAEIIGLTDDDIEFRNENGEFTVNVREIARAKIIF
ncbi:MAG: ribosome maturation factor RimP [Candidatus Zixiibacteriota bacterium]|nr:MAG: ribosome maturation factor RimP [candidate division Zixibacteria bacterium]